MKRTCALPGCTVVFEIDKDSERSRNTPKYCGKEHRKEAQRAKNKARYIMVKENRKRRKQFFL